MGKVIITAALTGNIHTPSMSPYLPLTPEDLINEAVRCEQAGATVRRTDHDGDLILVPSEPSPQLWRRPVTANQAS